MKPATSDAVESSRGTSTICTAPPSSSLRPLIELIDTPISATRATTANSSTTTLRRSSSVPARSRR